MVRDVPSLTKDEDIGERHARVFGFGSEDAEDGWIDMVSRYTPDIDEFTHVVFVWNITVFNRGEHKVDGE